ncbi:hypothetical protein ABZZ74_50065 [Streptomyces sp. NPDC006476]|uniref:hypothetical protein n=1 Tax=Streptomyces sp. NPDC006476 TaxID=3157175 RepID=UPI0033ADD673
MATTELGAAGRHWRDHTSPRLSACPQLRRWAAHHGYTVQPGYIRDWSGTGPGRVLDDVELSKAAQAR